MNIRPITRSTGRVTQPRRLAFLACESDIEHHPKKTSLNRHRLRLAVGTKWLWSDSRRKNHALQSLRKDGVSYRRSEETTIRNTDELYKWIQVVSSKRYQTWVFIDRASRTCQLTGLFDLIKSGCLRVDRRQKPTPEDPDADFFSEAAAGMFVISDPPTILALRTRSGNRIIVVDVRNYFPTSTAELGEQIGLSIIPCNDGGESDQLAEFRTRRRVEIIERAIIGLIDWLDHEGYGSLKYTSAGVAYQAWRRQHQWSNIWPHGDEYVRRLERAAYYGGEYRQFRYGKVNEPCWQVDVNSLYPSVMFGLNVPIDFKAWTGATGWKAGNPPGDPNGLLCEVWLRSMKRAWPKRIDGKVCYVRGSFPTVLCGPELAEAIRCGYVVGYRLYARYRTFPLFSEFVQDLYLKRLEFRADGNRAYEVLAKMMLNSLYGKFAQLSQDILPRTDFLAPQQWGTWQTVSLSTGKRRSFRCLDHQPYEEVDRKEIARTFPSISGWITSAARVRMNQIVETAGVMNCVYQAVDSLIVTRPGWERLLDAKMVDPDALGALKLQTQAPGAYVRGWGDYQIGSKRVLVGMKDGAKWFGDVGFVQPMSERAKSIMFRPESTEHDERMSIIKAPDENPKGEVFAGAFVRPTLAEERMPDDLIQAISRRNNVVRDHIDENTEV